MTDKMQMLYMDMVASIGQLPEGQKGYIFGFRGEEDYDWVKRVADYIVLEYIKYSYDYSDPTYSIKHFHDASTDPDDLSYDSKYERQKRIMRYVMDYKNQSIERMDITLSPDHKFAVKNMSEMDNKLDGYKITEMNYFENQNILNLKLIKAIVEGRIFSSKNVSNSDFEDMFTQYDEFVGSLIERSKKSDKDMVFASLAFFTFEWNYPVELFYNLSCLMEDEGIDTVDQHMLSLLCNYVSVESRFGGWFNTDSRMVKERLIMLPVLFGKDSGSFLRYSVQDLFREILALSVFYREVFKTNDGELYKDWFRKESSMEDWASFLSSYNIFEIWQKKEWTGKRIRKMRYLFETMFLKK